MIIVITGMIYYITEWSNYKQNNIDIDEIVW